MTAAEQTFDDLRMTIEQRLSALSTEDYRAVVTKLYLDIRGRWRGVNEYSGRGQSYDMGEA